MSQFTSSSVICRMILTNLGSNLVPLHFSASPTLPGPLLGQNSAIAPIAGHGIIGICHRDDPGHLSDFLILRIVNNSNRTLPDFSAMTRKTS